MRLVAASTAPPIIHRQVLPNGAAILPVLSNPGPDSATAAPGQPHPAPANTVSVDAEAFAAAGGRMTSWEWQQLQRFRDAVADCRSLPEASPLLLESEHLASHSLTTGDPGVSFAVKQAVLTPHRRLMDSVCRFAFPATHGLLAAGWQMQNPSQQHASRGGPAPAARAAAQQLHQQAPSEQAAPARQQQQTQQLQQQQSAQALPVPVPSMQQPYDRLAALAQHCSSELAANSQAGQARQSSDHGSSGGCLASNQPAAAAGAQAEPAALSRLGSLPGSAAQVAASSWPADPALQLRVQAAANAAGTALGRSIETRLSWGSAAGADPQAHQQGSTLPQQGSGQAASGLQSWGTAASGGRQQGSASHAGATTSSLTAGGMLQLCQHMAGSGTAPEQQAPCQNTAEQPEQAQQTQQAGASNQHPHRGQAWSSDGASTHGPPPGVGGEQQPQLEGAGSIPTAQEGEGAHTAWGATDLAAMQPGTAAGLIDLPALRQQCSSTRQPLAVASSAGAGEGGAPVVQQPQQLQAQQGSASAPMGAGASSSSIGPHALAALQRALVEDFVLYEEASAARQHVVGILVAVEQGDAAAGQRLLAPACAELIAATAPASVPNRLAPYLNSPAVVSAAAVARASGAGPAEVASAVAMAAAEEYCKHTQGIHRLLGSASSSRAALEASPRQLRQQRQQQQLLLVRALQQVSNRVPWLSRLLSPLQHSLGPDNAESEAAASPAPTQHPAAAAPEPAAQQGSQLARRPSNAAQTGPGQLQEGLAQQQAVPAAVERASAADNDAGQLELQAAVVELIMQLPELLHGLPGPALLTYEQYMQRYTQAQQLAAHAMQLLLPGAHEVEGIAAAAADGVAAELAASGLLAAASAAMAASQAVPAGIAGTHGSPSQQHNQAGHLFANILDSLRGPGAGAAAEHAAGGAAEAALAAAYGARGAAGVASGFLSRTAAFAAANRLADGLIRPATGTPPSSLGLSRGGSIAGAGQVGAWRLGGAAAAAAGGLMTPGAGVAAAGLGIGMFAPTGTGALLSGGLLAEGGVAGDSILDDVLHGNVRRITCHGLYELCAALAQPAGAQGSPPTAAQQQHLQSQHSCDPGREGGAGNSLMETDDSNRSSEGRVSGQHVAEAVATIAAAAVAVESNRRSSTHSMGPPPATGLVGSKRRLSCALDEQERPLKH